MGEGVLGYRLEGLLDIDILLGRRLVVREVVLVLAPGEGALLRHLKGLLAN